MTKPAQKPMGVNRCPLDGVHLHRKPQQAWRETTQATDEETE